MQSDTKTSRGRPRAYDPDTAINAALEVFRAHGYSGTSLDMLSKATAMNRPSLYAAFGNKKAIYRAALAFHQRRLRRKLGRVLFAGSGLREDLTQFYLAALEEYRSPKHGHVGCSTLCTATTEAMQDSDIRGDLSIALNRIDAAFRRRFRQAAAEYPQLDPRSVAYVAASILHSLAIRVRADQSDFSPEEFIQVSVTLLLKPWD